MVQLFHRKLRH